MGQNIKTITIRFEYNGNVMVLPINPRNVEIRRDNSNYTTDIISLGEVVVPAGPDLATIEIKSFLWQEKLPEGTTTKYIKDWFATWQRSKKYAKWTIEELGYELFVVVNSFNYDVIAGSEDDIYYELSLLQFRDYASKVIEPLKKPPQLMELTETQSIVESSPARPDNAPSPPTYHIVKSNETLGSIAIKYSGKDDWNPIYNIPENKKNIGNNPHLIRVGTILIIPPEWVNK